MTKGEIRSFVANTDTVTFTQLSGGTVSNQSSVQQAIGDNGVNQPNMVVQSYFDTLRELATNRFYYKSKILSDKELNLIEWYIFHNTFCTFVRPIFTRGNNSVIKLLTPRIYPCNITRFNNRTFEPLSINLTINNNNENLLGLSLQPQYNITDFEMITDKKTFNQNRVSMAFKTWEYANKLHELDLAFNANSHKMRLPMLFNNGSSVNQDNDKRSIYSRQNGWIGTITNVIRGAMNRNEQFVEIPQEEIGTSGILHNTSQYQNNNLQNFIETQRRIYDEFFEFIGIDATMENKGSYQAEAIQLVGLRNNRFKTEINLENRRRCLVEINEKFGLDITVHARQAGNGFDILGQPNTNEEAIYNQYGGDIEVVRENRGANDNG
jgi:hypothetical protein